MTKQDKDAKSVPKTQQLKKWSNKHLVPFTDKLMSLLGAIFIIATSFLYVRDWLAENQINRDFSVAGSILLVTVAIFLYIRKR